MRDGETERRRERGREGERERQREGGLISEERKGIGKG